MDDAKSSEENGASNGDPPVPPPDQPPPPVPPPSSNEEDEKRSLFQNLSDGFTFLRRRRDEAKNLEPPSCVLPSFLKHVTVNFIDPTTTSMIASSSSTTAKSQDPSSAATVQLYEKFAAVFERDYNSTLSYVPYELFRNNYSGVVERLPVKTVCARSHGLVLLPDAEESGGGSGLEEYPWERPYCHVYLAACESLEHYRTKVKPSIQVFVSQLEAAYTKQKSRSAAGSAGGSFRRQNSNGNANNNEGGSSSLHGGSPSTASSSTTTTTTIPPGSPPSNKGHNKKKKHALTAGPRYVIVYVPTGDRSKSEVEQSPKKGAGKLAITSGIGSRFAAARQRMAAVRGESNAMPLDSGHNPSSGGGKTGTAGGGSADAADNSNHGGGDDGSGHGSSGTQHWPSIQKLTKVEREIVKRFAHDFPNGNVCTLSTLIAETAAASGNLNDADAAAAAAAAEEDGGGSSSYQKLEEWNGVMKAMGAAISAGFQDRCQRYDDELRKLDQQRRGGVDAMTTQPDSGEDGAAAAAALAEEDFHLSNFWLIKENLAFTYEQMRLPGEALLQYEELRAFLPDPDEVPYSPAIDAEGVGKDKEDLLEVALTGQALVFRGILRSYGEFLPIANVAEEYLFARELALLFQMHKSVRVVQSCLAYVENTYGFRKSRIDVLEGVGESTPRQLIEVEKWAFDFCWDLKRASDVYRVGEISPKTGVDIAFARAVGDLLEFARLRLVELGQFLVPGNTVASTSQGLVRAIQHPWPSWEEPSPSEDSLPDVVHTHLPFLESALSSADSFLLRYLDLTKAIADCNESCGRKRLASTLRIKRMELLDSRGDKANAAKEILSIVDIYKEDAWSACHFALLFRLASFQRQIGSATDYLETLVHCFSEALSSVAPPKAQAALHADLESVVACKSIEKPRFTTATIFAPVFGLEGFAATQALGSDRNLLKKLYTVGDTVRVTFALTSFLPKSIEVDQIVVKLVAFRTYVAAMEDNHPVEECDVFRVLLVKDATVNSGKNEFTLDWLPKSSGQYIISSATVTWNGAEFVYTAKELRRPTIRVDIVPCEPTQSLKVKPDYLLPGQEQLVTFEFSAGSDVVKEGTLQVVGSPGLLFLPPGFEDQKDSGQHWTPSFDMPLPSCPPSETVLMKSFVKVVLSQKTSSSIQPVQVKVTTSYMYGSDESDESPTEVMETSLEAKIPTLGKPALSVVDGTFMAYSIHNAMMNVMLQCNTPAPLTVKSWQLDLPPRVVLSDVGDLNESLANEEVSLGEQISLCFDCAFNDTTDSSAETKDDPVLHVDFLTDDGESFRESLKLRIGRSALPTTKPPEIKPVDVKISSSVAEGMAGVPTRIFYAIDQAELANLTGKIVYKIDADDADWILSGKIEGPVETQETSNQQISVFAIPARCGRIARFPGIKLSLQNETGVTSLPVSVGASAVFTSLSPPNHVTVAFPTASGTTSRKRSNSNVK